MWAEIVTPQARQKKSDTLPIRFPKNVVCGAFSVNRSLILLHSDFGPNIASDAALICGAHQ